MICLASAEVARGVLCEACAGTLAPATEQHLHGVLVRSAFAHSGAARRLVHRLKYEGLDTAARPLAAAMAPLLPAAATCLVPVPRVTARRWRHGIDPATELAGLLAATTGLTVIPALRPVLWVARRAGPAGRHRGRPRFLGVSRLEPGAVLIDDVVTTGTTLGVAASVTGARHAVTATAGLRP
jgi:predicted amidophosphoribosyltransferase